MKNTWEGSFTEKVLYGRIVSNMAQALDKKDDWNKKEGGKILDYPQEQELLDKHFEQLTSQLGDLLEMYPLITITKKPDETGKSAGENNMETFLSEIPNQKMSDLHDNLKQNQLLQKVTDQIIKNENLQIRLQKNGTSEDSPEILTLKAQCDLLYLFREEILCGYKLIHTFKTIEQSEDKSSKEYKDLRNKLAISIGDFYDTIYGSVEAPFIKNALNTESGQKIIQAVKDKNPEFYGNIEAKLKPYIVEEENQHFFQEKADIQLYQPLIDVILKQSKHFLPQEMVAFKKSENEINQEEMGKYAQQILENIYADEKYSDILSQDRWQVELTNRTSCSANQATKKLEIPNKNYTKAQFLGSMCHEVFIHIVRNINGSKITNLPFFRDYLNFEEGLASTIQQITEGKQEITFGGKQIKRLVIALASSGLSYQEVKKVLEINEDEVISSGSTVEEELTRIYRGTAIPINEEVEDVEVNKAIYHKDKAYFQGSYKVYLMMKKYAETQDTSLKSAMDKVFNNIQICKFDALNIRHIKSLQQHFDWSEAEKTAYFNFLTGREEEQSEIKV